MNGHVPIHGLGPDASDAISHRSIWAWLFEVPQEETSRHICLQPRWPRENGEYQAMKLDFSCPSNLPHFRLTLWQIVLRNHLGIMGTAAEKLVHDKVRFLTGASSDMWDLFCFAYGSARAHNLNHLQWHVEHDSGECDIIAWHVSKCEEKLFIGLWVRQI